MSSWASQLFAQWRREGPEKLKRLEPYVRRLAGSGGHQVGWRGALALLLHEAGQVEEARGIYEQELEPGPQGLPHGMFWLTRIALLSEMCAKLGDVARAELLYAELAPHASRNVVVAYCSFWGPVDGYLALLAETAGDPVRAAEHARSAVDRSRAIHAPLLARDLEIRFDHLVGRRGSHAATPNPYSHARAARRSMSGAGRA